MKGILGRKVGMTEVFTTSGKLIPVTVIEIDKNVITQIKTVEKNGYDAIQLGAFDKKEKSSNKPEIGHAKKANTLPKRFVKEIRGIDTSIYEVGQVIDINVFEEGEIVDVTGISKGKGFQGVIKRWNQSCGPASHGSQYHRRVGSMGSMRPMRVLKGKKLPGRMGGEQVTIQNLVIVSVDVENNCILVSGNVPGAKGSFVFIKTAVKGNQNKNNIELVSYEVDASINEEEKLDETIETNIEPEEKMDETVIEELENVEEEVKEATEVEVETKEETNNEEAPEETKTEVENEEKSQEVSE